MAEKTQADFLKSCLQKGLWDFSFELAVNSGGSSGEEETGMSEQGLWRHRVHEFKCKLPLVETVTLGGCLQLWSLGGLPLCPRAMTEAPAEG